MASRRFKIYLQYAISKGKQIMKLCAKVRKYTPLGILQAFSAENAKYLYYYNYTNKITVIMTKATQTI